MRELEKIREKVVIRLDNQQVAIGILGFVLVAVITFSAGVFIGKEMSPDLPNASVDSEGAALQSHGDFRKRDKMLDGVGIGTSAVHEGLLEAPSKVVASHAGSAAIIETHRQLAALRARGVARSLGPQGVAGARNRPSGLGPPTREDIVQRNPRMERAARAAAPVDPSAYALQVSSFSQMGPAGVMVSELKRSGHDARVRPITRASGQSTFSVEVGRFADAGSATRFQRTFERRAGYPTILIPVR